MLLFSRQRGRGDRKEHLSLFVLLPMLGLLTFLSLRKYWQYLLQSWETFQSVRVTHLGVGEPWVCVFIPRHTCLSSSLCLWFTPCFSGWNGLIYWIRGIIQEFVKNTLGFLVRNGNSSLVTAHSLVREDCLCHHLLERILLTPSSWGCTSVLSYGLLCQLWGHRDFLVVCELLSQGCRALHNCL